MFLWDEHRTYDGSYGDLYTLQQSSVRKQLTEFRILTPILDLEHHSQRKICLLVGLEDALISRLYELDLALIMQHIRSI